MDKAQEIENVVEGEEVVIADIGTDDVELDDDGNAIVKDDEVELDKDGNPKKPAVEPWLQTGEEDGDTLPDVPVGKHIKMKEKLKGRIKDRDTELEKANRRIADLEASGNVTTELPPRPKQEDFDSDEKHEEALEEWQDKKLELKLQSNADKTRSEEEVRQHTRAVAKAVDDHYGRQAELVDSTGMKAEYFKEADTAVRETVEAILPRQGDGVTDHIISLLGEGSEKVMFFIGRNKAARIEFQSLLSEDRTGMKAMLFLGQQKERLTNPSKPTSRAPKPASTAKGDEEVNQKGSALKKKYQAAHKANKTQVAYNIKKQAKAAKVDVSDW